eukprot:GFYU01000142.1.p1 GENE.GFYU01000142.1~~GFYU01000142.1.p1  ORF type:complete len:469 (-),score=113.58 GFYU01000142.1:147-1553(-)
MTKYLLAAAAMASVSFGFEIETCDTHVCPSDTPVCASHFRFGQAANLQCSPQMGVGSDFNVIQMSYDFIGSQSARVTLGNEKQQIARCQLTKCRQKGRAFTCQKTSCECLIPGSCPDYVASVDTSISVSCDSVGSCSVSASQFPLFPLNMQCSAGVTCTGTVCDSMRQQCTANSNQVGLKRSSCACNPGFGGLDCSVCTRANAMCPDSNHSCDVASFYMKPAGVSNFECVSDDAKVMPKEVKKIAFGYDYAKQEVELKGWVNSRKLGSTAAESSEFCCYLKDCDTDRFNSVSMEDLAKYVGSPDHLATGGGEVFHNTNELKLTCKQVTCNTIELVAPVTLKCVGPHCTVEDENTKAGMEPSMQCSAGHCVQRASRPMSEALEVDAPGLGAGAVVAIVVGVLAVVGAGVWGVSRRMQSRAGAAGGSAGFRRQGGAVSAADEESSTTRLTEDFESSNTQSLIHGDDGDEN